MQKVNKIAVVNEAGAIVRARPNPEGTPSPDFSQNIIIGQFQVLDLASIKGIKNGMRVTAEIEGVADGTSATARSDSKVQYDKDANAVATYIVKGTLPAPRLRVTLID